MESDPLALQREPTPQGFTSCSSGPPGRWSGGNPRHAATTAHPTRHAIGKFQRRSGTELATTARNVRVHRLIVHQHARRCTLVQPVRSHIRLHLRGARAPPGHAVKAHTRTAEQPIGIAPGHNRAVGFGVAQIIPAVVPNLQLRLQVETTVGSTPYSHRITRFHRALPGLAVIALRGLQRNIHIEPCIRIFMRWTPGAIHTQCGALHFAARVVAGQRIGGGAAGVAARTA